METAEKQRGRPFKKGESGNPNGRPNGRRNYETVAREALRKIGEAKNMTVEEVEEALEVAGLEEAFKNNDKFSRDFKDRYYGKPAQPLEHTGEGGGPIEITIKRL